MFERAEFSVFQFSYLILRGVFCRCIVTALIELFCRLNSLIIVGIVLRAITPQETIAIVRMMCCFFGRTAPMPSAATTFPAAISIGMVARTNRIGQNRKSRMPCMAVTLVVYYFLGSGVIIDAEWPEFHCG